MMIIKSRLGLLAGVLVSLTALSSCSVFKRVTTFKSKEKIALDQSATITTTVEEKSEYSIKLDESTNTLTVLKADQIRIDPDGSILADGHASVEQSKVESRNSGNSGNSERITVQSAEYSDNSSLVKKEVDKVSAPDQKIAGKLIGVGVIFLILIGIAVYLKRKSP